MTTQAILPIITLDILERRKQLYGKRHSINFYGGWYSVDNVTGATKSHETMVEALDQAELENA
jgi:hypothetical protein